MDTIIFPDSGAISAWVIKPRAKPWVIKTARTSNMRSRGISDLPALADVFCGHIAVFVVRLRYGNAQGCGRDEYDPDEQVFHFDAPYVSPLVLGMESS